MVQKSDGTWRMCIYYKDLNRACPKDNYPLPEIDLKVDSLAEFPVKCFLDAYKVYHQVQMAEEDENKTAFHTDIGIFCYKKMPFGLKNAGATYQRMMDIVFKDQIGKNVEVYVDDLVIKSRGENNAGRCGGDNDPVAQLKHAEKSLPFIATLKKETEKEFQWTVEADQAFQALKKCLEELPALTAPRQGEVLQLYLSASEKAVCSVLLVERDGIQTPVYYVSRALTPPEINYTMLEKLVLALVHSSRRLRRYFQAHQVEEEPQGDPQKAPEEDPTEESSYRMPPRFHACKRPRFESDDVARLTWESKWANDRIEHMAQELRDVNARYVELRSVVQGMESHIVHLITRVQEEEHRADIAEGRLIALEEQFVSEAEEEEEEEEIPAQDVDSDADSTIEDA
ncbi:hypothetical protein E3N88_24185 [Mikania micrantha]|uniref:Reverse transcriptase/retrotransposon-derived protein RNase H-like domain-containing protein n=1 Tax=Mikania micrantha TaxID=192012 RepID=A0A5N6NFJ2_9ASTR|nr:hypothetical protein E3N88_24185 [Mikania micrantha]